MTTFTATVTDSAGRTATVTFVLGDAMAPGSAGTASVAYAVSPADSSGSLATALDAFTAAVGPGAFTRLYAATTGIPTSVYGAGDGPAALRAAAGRGMSVYLACSTGYSADAFDPASVTAPVTALTASMVAAGLTGYLCLDPGPQDDNPAWRTDLPGGRARLAAARWRAAQRAAARAVWAADPSGRIGYSTTELPWRDGQLGREYWNPATTAGDELTGETPWSPAEQAAVLLSLSVYPTLAPGTGGIDAEPMDTAAADYDWWHATAGYTRMGLGLTGYNTDALYPAPDETRIAQLIRGTGATGLAITGSLGEWVSRKRAAGSLRQLAWDDSYQVTGGAGLHGSARESAARAAALSQLAATTTPLPYPEPFLVSSIASGQAFGTAQVKGTKTLTPTGIASAQATGTATVSNVP